jgi:hypothetical protein
MDEVILVAYRRQAHALIQLAQTRAQKERAAKENAECVLRNRAKLLAQRLSETKDAAKRRKILRQAFRIA